MFNKLEKNVQYWFAWNFEIFVALNEKRMQTIFIFSILSIISDQEEWNLTIMFKIYEN